MAAEKKQYIVFQIDTKEYGADIDKVTIIEKLLNITRVPKTPPHIKGVINLRGDIIPVMDMRTRFGLVEKEGDDDTRIIILTVNKVSYGIIVDAVSEVIQLDETKIESVSGIINNNAIDYVSGVAKTDSSLITLLNLEKLIADLVTV